MLRRTVFIERGAVVGACAIAPLIAALLHFGTEQIPTPKNLLLPLLWLAPLLGALGAGIGMALHRSRASGHVQWGGHSETSALLKQGVGELVGGQPDNRLNESAMAQANAQEGRATAIYLYSRMAQLRQAQVLKHGLPNPIPRGKRIAWSLNTLLVSASALMLPPAMASGLTWPMFVIPGLLLLPIWVTGVLICGLGEKNADSWLRKLPGREYKPKLKPRASKTVAGSWHTRESRQDIPVIRGLIAALLIIAGALYFLREYGSVYFTVDKPIDVAADIAAARTPTPRVDDTGPSERTAPRPVPAAPTPAPAATPPIRASMKVWSQLPPHGVILQVDANTLAFAGWDIDQVSNAFDAAKGRLDQWYVEYLRDHPDAQGRITLQLNLQPWGGVSDIEMVATEISESQFIYGLIDRLEAIDLSSGALDPVPVLVSMDFRP